MQWQRESNGTLVLFIWSNESKKWIRYNNHPCRVPDHQIPNGSSGFATAQNLLKQGYKYIPTNTED